MCRLRFYSLHLCDWIWMCCFLPSAGSSSQFQICWHSQFQFVYLQYVCEWVSELVCAKCKCFQCQYVNVFLRLICIYPYLSIHIGVCVYCLWAKLKNKSSSLIITWLITFYEITVNNTESVDFLIGISFSVSASALCVCLLQLYTFTYVKHK